MVLSKFKPKEECCGECAYDCTGTPIEDWLTDVDIPVLNSAYMYPLDMPASKAWSSWLPYAESSYSVVVQPCIFNRCSDGCDPSHTLWSTMIRVVTNWYIDANAHLCVQWRTRFTATWSSDNSDCACKLNSNMFGCSTYVWPFGCDYCANGGVTDHCVWGGWSISAQTYPQVTTLGGTYGYIMSFRIKEADCGCGKCCDRTCTLSDFESSYRCFGVDPSDPCYYSGCP